MKSYYEELQDLHHRRVYYILLAGAILLTLFSFLDLVMAPAHFNEFLLCRLFAIFTGIALLIFNYRDKEKVHPLTTGFLGYLCVTIVILAMVNRMGGASSPYYVGLILAMTIHATLAPLTPGQTLNSGFLLICFYGITILFSQPLTHSLPLELFANLFFMVCFVLIIATQSWADTNGRKAEHKLRLLENEAAEQLSRQAAALEAEVEKRSREQAALDRRYRLLFSQIADDVIFINLDGEILQSNHNFDAQYGSGHNSNVSMTIYNVTLEKQHPEIRALLKEIVATRQPINNFSIQLQKQDSTITEAEMNGNLLLRDQDPAGILLVIRDISTRKKMEHRLIQSLEIKKKTETAAILALAKLSEFRDVASGHHLERIREYCKILATELAQSPDLTSVITSTYIEDIYHASILHDIGKVATPDELLSRKTPLEDHENDLIRRHTIIGGDVIREMEEESKGSGFLDMAKYIAYFHHERWDGRGYPYGLMKREIPLAARIMALADFYEEMTAETPENPEMGSHETIKEEIIREVGCHFDPMVVEAFITCHAEFDEIRQKYS